MKEFPTFVLFRKPCAFWVSQIEIVFLSAPTSESGRAGRKPRASCFRLQTQTTQLRPMKSHKEESYLYYLWGWKDGRRELKRILLIYLCLFWKPQTLLISGGSHLDSDPSLYLFRCSPCASPNQENASVASFSRGPPYWVCNFNLVMKSQSAMSFPSEVDQITRTMCGDGW